MYTTELYCGYGRRMKTQHEMHSSRKGAVITVGGHVDDAHTQYSLLTARKQTSD